MLKPSGGPGFVAGVIFMAALAVAPAIATAQAPPQVPAKIEANWLKVDSAHSTAEFMVVAGLTGANGNMNFNGAVAGGLVLTVPAHWHVVLHFRNNDQILPHSAEVIPETSPVPQGPQPPAFPQAATGHLQQGMGPDAHQDVRFTADHAGSFLIFCAVPGHGAAGMWIRLTVSATATRPSMAAAPARPG